MAAVAAANAAAAAAGGGGGGRGLPPPPSGSANAALAAEGGLSVSRGSSITTQPGSGRSGGGGGGGGGRGVHFRSASLSELSQAAAAAAARGPGGGPVRTWVHDLFQGKLVNETRCLQCEAGACGAGWGGRARGRRRAVPWERACVLCAAEWRWAMLSGQVWLPSHSCGEGLCQTCASLSAHPLSACAAPPRICPRAAVTSREEDFYDLSLEIDQNCSLTQCLRNFRRAGGARRGGAGRGGAGRGGAGRGGAGRGGAGRTWTQLA